MKLIVVQVQIEFDSFICSTVKETGEEVKSPHDAHDVHKGIKFVLFKFMNWKIEYFLEYFLPFYDVFGCRKV